MMRLPLECCSKTRALLTRSQFRAWVTLCEPPAGGHLGVRSVVQTSCLMTLSTYLDLGLESPSQRGETP